MGSDLGPPFPDTGWSFLMVNSIITAVIIAAAVLGIVIGIVRSRRSRTRSALTQLPAVPPLQLESRLAEIDSLLAAGRIDNAEHAAMRSRILDLR